MIRAIIANSLVIETGWRALEMRAIFDDLDH